MKKYDIFEDRKTMKKASHRVLRSHYFLLVFLTLLLIFFGSEFKESVLSFGDLGFLKEKSGEEAGKTDVGNILTMDDVFTDISKGKLDEGALLSDELSASLQEKYQSFAAMGLTEGVLAHIVNEVWSGKLFVKAAQSIRFFTRSERASSVIFVICSLIVYTLALVFFMNVYSAVIRRIYLEARIYERVFFTDVFHFAFIHRWIRASWVMLVTMIYRDLWGLTIVGGLIKHYSYAAVPYIVAENPSLKPNQAITLSRKMMDGHKMELFLYDLSMLGWVILGVVTYGVSELAYGVPYRIANETEFYARVRQDAIARGVEGIEVLNDPWLFAKADKILLYETYFNVVDEITLLHEEKVEMKSWQRFLADWFGVWWGTLDQKKKYDDLEGRRYSIEYLEHSMKGIAYPRWLNPVWPKKEIEKQGQFSFLRNYSLWTLFLLFIVFSFVGWTWEVALHYMQTGLLANRGKLYGPWLPIYGSGGLIALCLCARFRKKPALEFLVCTGLCGVLEYMTAWLLETNYHTRWWSYDGYFLNLHGRICAEGLLVFGLGCCLVVYFFAPVFDYLMSGLNKKVLIGISLAFAILFTADSIYSSFYPNLAEGAIEADQIQAEDLPPEALAKLSLPSDLRLQLRRNDKFAKQA